MNSTDVFRGDSVSGEALSFERRHDIAGEGVTSLAARGVAGQVRLRKVVVHLGLGGSGVKEP